MTWVPDACTLPTPDRPLRVAEFADLFARALSPAERPGPEHLRLRLHGGEEVGAAVRDLAAHETRCCSFFTFDVTRADVGWVVDIRVPAAQAAVLDGIAETVSRR